jgi:hypothetical protein
MMRFDLGQIVATPGALDATTPQQRDDMLRRHASGDWGVVGKEDSAANDAAVVDGDRILSAYPIDPAQPCAGHGARPRSCCHRNTKDQHNT